MVYVDVNYNAAIHDRNLRTSWYGSITLKSGTVLNFDMSNINDGSGELTMRCSSDSAIELGGGYASELKIGLKIPKVKLSGGKAPWGIAGKGKLPSFHVSWAAKGGIVDGATLIGAGEKGAEAIVPLDPFWKKLDETSGIDYERLAEAMVNVLSSVSMVNYMVVDGKVVAQSTAPYMRKEINNLDTRASRSLGIVGV